MRSHLCFLFIKSAQTNYQSFFCILFFSKKSMVGFEEGINFDGSVFALDEEQIAHSCFEGQSALFCNGFAASVAIHNAGANAMETELAETEIDHFFQCFRSNAEPPIAAAEDITDLGGIVCKVKGSEAAGADHFSR